MSANRYLGAYPVIGIRRIIDARLGPLKVRQSLEDQTMGMAEAAKRLITENVRCSNGDPVKVVISECSIGRGAEAARVAAQFKREGVDITISVTPCWCYGAETMDMDPSTIKAVWGFNATERPGAVYLACVLAAYAQKGLPAFGIYGHDVQEADDRTIPADVQEKLLRFARAAVAAATMKGKSYLAIGGTCMGIAGSMVNPDFFEEYLGMRVESVDEVEILRRMEEKIYDEAEYQRALKWAREKLPIGLDKNPEFVRKTPEETQKAFEFAILTMVIIKDLMQGNPRLPEQFGEEALGFNAIAGGFQGQRQWTDHWPDADVAEALLNSTFDWEGARESFVFATENDSLNGATMLLLKLLTNRAQMFADVRTYWSGAAVKRVTGYDIEGHAREADGFIHLINSGACALDACGQVKDASGQAVMKPFWEMTEGDIEACLKATEWCNADNGYFRGGGYSSRFVTEAEFPATMARLNLVKGLGPVLQLVEGWTVKLPHEVTDTLWKRTDYTWPCTWFTPRVGKGPFKSAYDVMNNWGANHGAISYGHVGADLITLCSILRIPVCMHNVDEGQIFRPAVWNSFGMDKEGQDYRACQNFGPRYGTTVAKRV
ncbi:MAG: L-fucose isomerase [Succinivibrionaceae bacterium]|nr:L-fucose isomerase [Succinivibrionaceae bacterium]